MVFFLPIIAVASIAGISLLSGCGGHSRRLPAAPKSTPPPPPLPPLPPGFAKASLDFSQADGSVANGYQFILDRLEALALRHGGQAFPLEALLKGERADFKIPLVFKDARQVDKAKEFLQHLAEHDGRPDDVSLYDLYFETQHLHGEVWQEEWEPQLMSDQFQASRLHRVRTLGTTLLDTSSSAELGTQTRGLLESLAVYAGLSHPKAPEATLPATLEFYLNGQEPKVFKSYLKTDLAAFLAMDAQQQAELFTKAVQKKFPELETVEKLMPYFTQQEAMRFVRACLKKDPAASLSLFEKFRFPSWEGDPKLTSGESDFFPSLPQNFDYKKRQKAIDAFLGKPSLTLKRKYTGENNKAVHTTLKKYLWVGDTEVFSIESGNPGPTTLVFSPHFDEQNPRKMFHWLKDLPLKTGRVIFLPEANRAIGLADGKTRPMNSLFNKAFTDDRIDYLVVRRTEYLMGLVDGMIGLHDWQGHDPFFISDLILDDQGKSAPGPTASPFIPADVQKIAKYSHSASLESKTSETKLLEEPLQLQWQIADFAATKLANLTGGSFGFTISPLANRDSQRIDNATAYMNFFLKKPAMTFEGTAEAEQGQLLARAVYSMLLGFGHSVDSKFEKSLEESSPKQEPDLYVGVPIKGSEKN